MTADPFQFVKGLQKGLKKISEKLDKSKNVKLQEMGKRLSEIDAKLSEKFDAKKRQDKKDEDQS